jgi:hypothetical protein
MRNEKNIVFEERLIYSIQMHAEELLCFFGGVKFFPMNIKSHRYFEIG